MKYTIVSAHRGIHGSFLNLLDLTDYLIRRGNKVDFVCLDIKEFYYRLAQTVRDCKLQDIYDLKTLRYERLNTLSKGVVVPYS